MSNSIQSTALEPTRSELAGLSFGQRLIRLLPTYGLVLLMLGFNVLGDAIRDVLDPRHSSGVQPEKSF